MKRVIPVLLLNDGGLYKTVKFKAPQYVGDPINAVKIFNEKEVDELIFLDISATVEGRDPDYKTLKNIASECFMPLCYGGGINTLGQIERILKTGVEKVAVNTALITNPDFVREASRTFGSSTIVASIDFRTGLLGKMSVYLRSGTVDAGVDPVELARSAEDMGAGEVLFNSIDRDGTLSGYDLAAIKKAADAISIPLIACGGGGSLSDFRSAIHESGASAVAAGAFFVFRGRHRAVLITYPTQQALKENVFC